MRWRWAETFESSQGPGKFLFQQIHLLLQFLMNSHACVTVRFGQQNQLHVDRCIIVRHSWRGAALCTTNTNQYNFIIIICFVATMIVAINFGSCFAFTAFYLICTQLQRGSCAPRVHWLRAYCGLDLRGHFSHVIGQCFCVLFSDLFNFDVWKCLQLLQYKTDTIVPVDRGIDWVRKN